MKTALKYLFPVAIAIAALTWFSAGVRSTEEEQEIEDVAAREAFHHLQDGDEQGGAAWAHASKQKDAMPVWADAWREFVPPSSVTIPIRLPWTSVGPSNIGGRIRAIILHPNDPKIMWIGSVTGGIWKTTDSGETWNTNTDFLANINVSCMVMDPTNPDVLYAGTGGETERGLGIFKTIDGGAHWSPLISTFQNHDFYAVFHIDIAPDGETILAGTHSGIFRSLDGGATWTRQLSGENLFDVHFNPANKSECVAGDRGGHAFYSQTGGETWAPAAWKGGPHSGTIRLAYAPSNPAIVYAQTQSENEHGQIYRSADGGRTFTLRRQCCGDVLWYSNCLWVDPINPEIVIFGGVNIFRSVDGGLTGTQINAPHVDHQIIVEHPKYNGTTNRTVYCGTDGGLARCDNILSSSITWVSLNQGLGITQFLGAAGNAVTGRIIGGTQDNGTMTYRPSTGLNWRKVAGGDGSFCAADQTDPNYFYGSYQELGILRSTDGGDSVQYIAEQIPRGCNGGVCANTTAPLVLDPNDHNVMLAGGSDLWKASNVHDEPHPEAVGPWVSIKSQIAPPQEHNWISTIAVAEGDSNVIWVGYNFGAIYHTTNGTAAAPTWTPVTGLPNRHCAKIAISGPSDGVSRRVYITFGDFLPGNIWKSDDAGASFHDISAGLPNMPIYTVAISSSMPGTLYLGTALGIFASNDDGAHWSPSNDGPANVVIYDLFWMGRRLGVATFGRGVFLLGSSEPQ